MPETAKAPPVPLQVAKSSAGEVKNKPPPFLPVSAPVKAAPPPPVPKRGNSTNDDDSDLDDTQAPPPKPKKPLISLPPKTSTSSKAAKAKTGGGKGSALNPLPQRATRATSAVLQGGLAVTVDNNNSASSKKWTERPVESLCRSRRGTRRRRIPTWPVTFGTVRRNGRSKALLNCKCKLPRNKKAVHRILKDRRCYSER